VVPALAVAEALRAHGAEVSVVTPGGRAGAGLAGAAGFPEDHIPLRGLDRRPGLGTVRAVALALAAVPRALRILRRRRADVVLTAGGYMAAPVALAARLRRRRVVAMEADSHLGLANRLVAPLAHRMALAHPLPGRRGRRYVVTGRPVRRAVLEATRTSGRRAFGVQPDETVVLVVGGSQGARSINHAAADAFGVAPPFTVLHVAGPRQVDEVRALLAARADGAGFSPRYRLEGFLDNLPEAVAAADLVVSRSGGSVFELAAIGRPSILVPYPHATADHQTLNARWLVEAGGAVLLPDAECTGPRLRELVGALLSDRRRLAAMADGARLAARPEAADEIAGMVLEAARRRRRAGRLRRGRRAPADGAVR